MLLWHRLVATAPIKPLAWERPYATGVALEKAKRQQQQQIKERCDDSDIYCSVLWFSDFFWAGLILTRKKKNLTPKTNAV